MKEYTGKKIEMNKVRVNIKFTGNISKVMGKDEMSFETSDNLEKALGDLRKEMIKVSPDILYTILVNGTHYSFAVKNRTELRDGDVLTVLPVTLGG